LVALMAVRRLPLSPSRSHTGDRQTDEIWNQISALARVVNEIIVTGFFGRLITAEEGEDLYTGLTFENGVTRTVRHGLGRPYRGFVLVQGSDATDPFDGTAVPAAHPSAATTDTTHVALTPSGSGSGTAFLWVF
jgi:hypothetical protein